MVTLRTSRVSLQPCTNHFVGAHARRLQISTGLTRRTRIHTQAVFAMAGKMKVAVTGAGGRTGSLVLKKMIARPDDFDAIAIVRSDKSKKELVELGLAEDSVFLADITEGITPELEKAFAGCDGVILATSGVPKINFFSLIGVFWGKIRGKEIRPTFSWKGNQMPEQVDWIGAKSQIDAAKKAGVSKFVYLSSMGGTDPDHPLNKLGDGNILNWKRKGEQYLLESGMKYTIIHPAGLKDSPGGEKTLVVGVDDKLLEMDQRSISREDVAEMCVQSITLQEAENRAFDVASKDGEPTTDFAALLKDMTENCDYKLNSQMESVEA